MLTTELLFVYVYCLVDDAIKAGVLVIPRRPGPAPACTDAELLAIAVVRHLLGRRSESGFLAGIRRDWPGLFPHLPDQPEVNRRTRWLWGAFVYLWASLAGRVPEDDCQQADTTALPVKHPSRVRGPDGWTGPGNDLPARFGRDAAHAEWRNRVETTFSEITDRMELARHGAHTFWGLLTRTAATIAAHTLLLVCLTEA